MGQDLGSGVTFEHGVEPRLRTHAAGKGLGGQGLGGATFKHGAGPLLRTPQKQRGSTSKE